MSSDESLYKLLGSPNRTEAYQACRQAGLNPDPSGSPERLIDALTRNTQPDPEDPLSAVDNIRCALDAFINANWYQMKTQIKCPAVDRTTLACGRCVDAQVMACFDQNTKQVRRYLVPLRRKHMNETPMVDLEDTLAAFYATKAQAENQFTLVGRLRASGVNITEIATVLGTPGTLDEKAAMAWEIISLKRQADAQSAAAVAVKQPKEKSKNMTTTRMSKRQPAPVAAPMQQQQQPEELYEAAPEEMEDDGYVEPEELAPAPQPVAPPSRSIRTPENRTVAAAPPAARTPPDPRRTAQPAVQAPAAPVAPVAPPAQPAAHRPTAPKAPPVQQAPAAGCAVDTETLLAALRGPLLEHQATASANKQAIEKLASALQVMNNNLVTLMNQNVLIMKAIAYHGFVTIVRTDESGLPVSLLPIDTFKTDILAVLDTDLPEGFIPNG